jgi:hypothetical protein
VIRVPTGMLARLTIGLAFAMAFVTDSAWATLANDCTNACHDASNQKHFNGAGASNIITYANMTMGASFTGGSTAASIAAEIQALMTSNYPNNEAITFQTAKTFNLPRIFHSQEQGPAAGATDSVSTVSAPSSGTVSYPAVANSANYQATYTPAACTTGNDSFSYRASGPGGNTSTRTATVVIANPTTAPVLSGSTPSTGQTGVAYNSGGVTSFGATCESAGMITYSITAGSLPPGLSLNTSTGAITGTPTTVGNYTGITIRARYNCCASLFDETTFAINITVGPPNITSAATAANSSVGVVFSGYTITATNSPTSFGATGLPPGLTVNPATGVISGTPTSAAGSP